MPVDGIGLPPEFDDRLLAARHPDDGGLDVQPTHGLGEAIIVREHDDLPGLRCALEHTGKTLDARRIHRLDRIVDHDEAERAFREGGPREEQTERDRAELTLAHHAQRVGLHAIDFDRQYRVTTRA